MCTCTQRMCIHGAFVSVYQKLISSSIVIAVHVHVGITVHIVGNLATWRKGGVRSRGHLGINLNRSSSFSWSVATQ